MPWIAKYNGQKKAPRQVSNGVDVECPSCGNRMRVWSRSSDGKARHFKHVGEMGHSEGGSGTAACESVAESDIHKKWKSLAADRLEQIFDGNTDTCEMERELQAPVSEKSRRVGDVVLVFQEQDTQLGEGVVAEVQHKNEGKDIEQTTADYVEQGYSVLWLSSEDFGEDRCRLAETDLRSRAADAAWPNHVPQQRHWWTPPHNYQSHADKWQKAKDQGLVKYGAPATLPREWNDEMAQEIWNSQRWTRIVERDTRELVNNPENRNWHAESYLQHVRSEFGNVEVEATLPREWNDQVAKQVWRDTEWSALFSDGYRPRKGKPVVEHDAERPGTVFEDVQCHSCENYIYYKEAGKTCKNCGEEYDWHWNLATNRISYDSVPDHVNLLLPL